MPHGQVERPAVPRGVQDAARLHAEARHPRGAAHAEVDAFWWPDATAAQAKRVEALSVSNLKRTWVADGSFATTATGRGALEHAVQVKNVWVPYGV